MRTSLLFAAFLAIAAPVAAQSPDPALLARALRLHAAVPMVDGHNDLAWELATTFGGSLDSADLGRGQPRLQTDMPRLRSGRVGAQFWSLWARTNVARVRGASVILEAIDLVRQMEARYPETLMPARSADDIMRAHRAGRIASLMGVEGGDYMQGSLGVLRQFYALGARYMTLTWNATLPWVDAAQDTMRHNGLTPFGFEVVREMNRLGMLVDISHVSDSVMAQVLRTSEAPVMFSHSSARALADHPRNVPDYILRMVPRNGGVVMVNFYCDFIDPRRVAWDRTRQDRSAMLRSQIGADTAGARGALAQWVAANPAPVTVLSVVADHIDHIRQVAGIDYVGYGSDFDGIDCAPTGLENVSMFPALTAELLRRGYTDDDVRKVIGLNFIRAFRGAEAAAARAQRTRGPSTATLAMDSTGMMR